MDRNVSKDMMEKEAKGSSLFLPFDHDFGLVVVLRRCSIRQRHPIRFLLLRLTLSYYAFLSAPLSLLLFVRFFVIAPDVLCDLGKGNVVSDSHDEEQPEQVHALQAGEQRKGYVLTDPAFVLIGFPIEFERADGAEFGEGGVQNYEVDVVAKIGPDDDEEGEVRDDERRVNVVEGF